MSGTPLSLKQLKDLNGMNDDGRSTMFRISPPRQNGPTIAPTPKRAPAHTNKLGL